MIDITNSISIGSSTSGISWSSYWTTHSPSNLIVTVYDTSIKLDWTDGTEAPDGIRIYVDSVEVDTVAHGVETYTITGLTELTEYDISVVGYSGSNESTALTSTTTTYRYRYVRPLGGAYGAENGATYAAAWNGFADITWAEIVPNTVLWVCGTHNETLNMGASGTSALHIQVRGDYTGDNGTIDGEDTIGGLMNSNSQNYIEYHYMTVCNAITTCVNNNGAYNIWHYNGHYYDSGDQVTEHNTGVTVVYTRCEVSGGVDDGFSMHTNAVVTLVDCIVSGCNQGVQSAGGASLTATGCTFENNVSHISLDCANDVSKCKFVAPGNISLVGTVSYCLFDVRTLVTSDAFIASTGTITVDNSTIVGKGMGILNTGTINLRNCIVYNIGPIQAAVRATNCNFCGIQTFAPTSNTGEIEGLPDFTDYNGGDFSLRATSPLLTVGADLDYTEDINGDAVPSSGIAIGCYQTPTAAQSNPSVDYFDVVAAGTGAVLTEIRLTSNSEQTLTLTGSAKFYSDSGGTLDESSTWVVPAMTSSRKYIKHTTGIERLWLDCSKITSLGGTGGTDYGIRILTNSPVVYADLSKFNSALTALRFTGTGGYCYGSIGRYSSLVVVNCADSRFVCEGDITNFTSLTYLVFPARLSGDIGSANMVNGITTLILNPCRMNTYTGGATWSNAAVTINPSTGYGYDQTEIGNIIIDMNNSASGPASKTIALQGANASMADTNQGGIWGDFSGVPAPTALATAYKNMIRVKLNTLTLNGITVPGVSGDGSGFPAGFGNWYRS